MAGENRRNARVPYHRPALLEVRLSSPSLALGATSTKKVSAQASLRDVSRSGLSLRSTAPLEKGAAVSVKVQVGARTLAMPGTVVWAKTEGGEIVAGIRMHVEVLDSATRRVFEGFIADVERTLSRASSTAAV